VNASAVAASIAIMIATQGATLISGNAANGAISMAAILEIVGSDRNEIVGWFMVTALPFSVIAFATRRWLSRPLLSLCLGPQLVISLVYAMGAISAIIRGSYADGVARPPQFIFVDQVAMIVLMILHAASVAEIIVKK